MLSPTDTRTRCQYMREEALQQRGLVLPRCDKDGHFDKVQCYLGICYCVDTNGRKVENTEKPSSEGRPDCDDPGWLIFFALQQIKFLVNTVFYLFLFVF